MQSKFITSRWLARGLIAGGILYVLLGTVAGPILYDVFGAVIRPIASPAAMKNWCDTGNWMVDKFQPLVSDERMMAHLQANQTDLEKLAWVTLNKQDTKPAGGLTEVFEREMKRLGIAWVELFPSWPAEPYSVEAAREEKACEAIQAADRTHQTNVVCRPGSGPVRMDPAFGRRDTANFCSRITTVAFKSYFYYPGVAPRIVDGKFQWGIDAEGRPIFEKNLVVPNADHVRQDICQVRRIAPHWFISVC